MGLKECFTANVATLQREVTGSCFIVNIQYPDERKTNFLVDCGLFQEAEYEQLNEMKFPFNCQNIEFALITHNHADHMARLPQLVRGGFKGRPIYATAATVVGMKEASLFDSYKIMKTKAKLRKQKQEYEQEDTEKVISNLVSCKIEETVYVDKNIKITFFDNGHLIGAGMILVQISHPNYKNEINILFTGDYKSRNTFKEVRSLPDWVKNLPLVIVIESTYGDTESTEIDYHFEDDVEKLLKEGKSLVTFVLAQERAQEILNVLKQMQLSGKISKEIPIYHDGKLSQTYTRIYLKGDVGVDEAKRDFLPENVTFVNEENREAILHSDEQKIVLTTSGMADHGPAQIYVERYISREDVVFYFTSFVAESTFGYKLLNPKSKTVKIKDNEYEINATILSTKEFSSHAKADELEKFVSQFKNVKALLVNHGRADVQEAFRKRIRKANLVEKCEPFKERIFRISVNGNISCMGSKLYSQNQLMHQKAKKMKAKSKTPKKEQCVKRNCKCFYR